MMTKEDSFTTITPNDSLTKQLKNFRLKNQQITSQVNLALERVETVVKGGIEVLNRPNNPPELPIKEKKTIKLPDVDKLTNAMENQLHEFDSISPRNGVDTQPDGSPALGLEATVRIMKAKVDVLEEELRALIKERQEKETNLAVAYEKIKSLDDQRVKDQRQLTTLTTQNEKLQKNLDEALSKLTSLQTDSSALKKELDIQIRNAKHSDQDAHSKDLRLNRALEELERAKSNQNHQQQLHKEALETANRTAQDLFAQCKRLQKQKSELLAGFKKQSQLIEILKRQKMHIEAAKMLQFTEEEFMKALN